jgi:hypothetical protein
MDTKLFPVQYATDETSYSHWGTAIFSFRTVKILLLWLICWQESTIVGSPFQVIDYLWYPNGIWGTEWLLLMLTAVICFERILIGDFTIRRSYFYGPLILIECALFFSWLRGCWINHSVRAVFEVHEAFRILPALFVILNGFRQKGDGRMLLQIVLFAGIAKAIDGAYIYSFVSTGAVGWGAVQMWRDGYILAYVIVGAFILLTYDGKRYRNLRRIVMIGAPLALFTLIVSLRRTFLLGLLVSMILLFFTVRPGKKKRHALLVLLLLVLLVIIVFGTNPIAFITRVSGVVDPGEEGSAYIRLMEFPNVILNIRDNPLFGVAIGTQWHQYFRMPLFAVFTTLGTHNTYLYWQLRTGPAGTIGFFWLLGRIWKSLILRLRFTRTEDEFLFVHLGIYLMVLYNVACFLGIMYGDAVTSITAVSLAAFQMELSERFGMDTLKNISLISTLRHGELILRKKAEPKALVPSV